MRSVLLVAHTARGPIRGLAARAIARLAAAGLDVRMLAGEARAADGERVRIVEPDGAAHDTELVLVLGGDGTFLRAVELARPAGVPLLGVNLGRVGFLAGAEPRALPAVIDAIVSGDYTVDERVTVAADVSVEGRPVTHAWALNEASLERTNRERMLEISVAIDDRPLLRFGCDGMLCATPTGSTAYAFSAGGPIVWPTVDALLVVPNAAHALFARPIIVAPSSTVEIELASDGHGGVLSCDGRRSIPVPAGARVRMRKGEQAVRIVRLGEWSFADRLVTKFQLPVRGFRDAIPDDTDLGDAPDDRMIAE